MKSTLEKIIRIPYKIATKIVFSITSVVKKIPFVWSLFTLRQLRYKFSALRYGIKENKKTPDQLFNLRRNIHRIEKGLSYSSVKSTFALDYVQQTVEILFALKDKSSIDDSTEKWAVSVLSEYFKATDSSNFVIKKAFTLFSQYTLDKEEDYKYYPYPISERHDSAIDFDALLDLSLKRRSVRYFENKKVNSETISKVFEIAKLAPSACNRQAFRYLYFNEPNVVNRLSKIPGGVSGYDLYNLVILVGDYNGYFNERDINAPVIDASLSAMSFLYACETVGLGTVCINWPNLPDREENIRKVIKLKKSEFIIMMIGLGYPTDSGKIPYSKKRSNTEFLEINQRIK